MRLVSDGTCKIVHPLPPMSSSDSATCDAPRTDIGATKDTKLTGAEGQGSVSFYFVSSWPSMSGLGSAPRTDIELPVTPRSYAGEARPVRLAALPCHFERVRRTVRQGPPGPSRNLALLILSGQRPCSGSQIRTPPPPNPDSGVRFRCSCSHASSRHSADADSRKVSNLFPHRTSGN